MKGIINTYRFIIAPDFFGFSSEGLDFPLRDTEGIQSDLQLSLDFIVMSSEFGQLERLLLNGLLQVNVHLVGRIERHFQFGNLNLELLLNSGDLGLKASFSFDNAGIELFYFNACSFAIKKNNEISVRKVLY